MLNRHAAKLSERFRYGSENGSDYWLVQNSWTTSWGDDGLFKIARGSDECGIESGIVTGSG